jgi:predicted RNA-binding Zn ribbon-like protein
VNFGSHTNAVVGLAVEVVNALTPGESGGRPYPAPTAAELPGHLARLLPEEGPLTAADTAGLVEIAGSLRAVFELVDVGDVDDAAVLVNTLVHHWQARPALSRHDGEPWHLHFHGPEASPAEGTGAGCATALAFVLGSEYADRVGVCSADGCDRVYVDTSRNGTKRYCSTACQNRVKAAAFRARRAAAPTR